MSSTIDALTKKVLDTITKNHLLDREEKVIVGFSGGIDSVCLLHVLSRLEGWHLDLWAVYINHSLRPAENLRESALLSELGTHWGIRTKELLLDIPRRLRDKPQSIQLLARKERYRMLLDFQAEIEADKIALAHHRDDQVETVLYRMVRGTGIDGLAGIPVSRDGIWIRPLYEVTRAEIRDYVQEHCLTWVEDSSNQKTIYVRNRIRHQLIPWIEADFNPRFRERMWQLSSMAREQHDYMESCYREIRPRMLCAEADRICVVLASFLELHPYMQYYLLRNALTELIPYYRVEVQALWRLCEKIRREKENFRRDSLYKGVVVYRENEVFCLATGWPEFRESSMYHVNLPGMTEIEEIKLRVTIEREESPPAWDRVGKWEAFVPCVAIKTPLKIRFWKHGDSFRPLGVNGAQKLHDFFINVKAPRSKRGKIPLLVTSGDEIVWVIGYRLNDKFKVSKTEPVWHIKVETLTADDHTKRNMTGGQFLDVL